MVPLEVRRNVSTACLMRQLVDSKENIVEHQRITRQNVGTVIYDKLYIKTKYNTSVFVCGPREWNKLGANIRLLVEKDKFKSAVKKYYYTRFAQDGFS